MEDRADVEIIYGNQVDSSIKRYKLTDDQIFAREAKNSLVRNSIKGDFELPEIMLESLDQVPRADLFFRLGLDFLYRAGMHEKLQDMCYFVKPDKKSDIDSGLGCIEEAVRLSGKDPAYKRAGRLFKDKVRSMLLMYERIIPPLGFSPYNFREYSIKKILSAAEDIEVLSSSKAHPNYISWAVSSACPSINYLFLKHLKIEGDQVFTEDKDIAESLSAFSKTLKKTKTDYQIYLHKLNAFTSLNEFFIHPIIDEPLREQNRDKIIDWKEFLTNIKIARKTSCLGTPEAIDRFFKRSELSY